MTYDFVPQVTDHHVATLTVLTRLTSLRLVRGKSLSRPSGHSHRSECSTAALCRSQYPLRCLTSLHGYIAVVKQMSLRSPRADSLAKYCLPPSSYGN